MFFIEHLCDMAQRENHMEYVNMMRRDILRVVDAVAPEDGSGAANVKVIRRVSFVACPVLSTWCDCGRRSGEGRSRWGNVRYESSFRLTKRRNEGCARARE